MDDSWEVGFEYMEEYIIANGSADLSANYVCPDGFQLGRWVERQRLQKNSMDLQKRRQLDQLKGWTWSPKDTSWDEGFEYLEEYVAAYGDADVPVKHIAPDGYKLYRWVERQRLARDQLSEERLRKLEKLQGWRW